MPGRSGTHQDRDGALEDLPMEDGRSCDRAIAVSLLVPALLMPVPAYAVQVGCFFTAVFLGIMFVVCLGLTELTKHLIARHLWKLPKTPWLRLFALTWLELFLGILIFASVRTNFWLTALIYLPIAALVNRALLARFQQTAAVPASSARSYGIFLLFAAALPVSLQVSGVLWRTFTNAITFTEIH
jgi:hypothetical protein